MGSTQGRYRNVDGSPGDGQVTLAKSDLQSYWYKLDLNNSVSAGRMANFIPTGNAEINLAAFNDPGANFVEQILYFYDTAASQLPGVPVALIRTYRDGHTEISSPPSQQAT